MGISVSFGEKPLFLQSFSPKFIFSTRFVGREKQNLRRQLGTTNSILIFYKIAIKLGRMSKQSIRKGFFSGCSSGGNILNSHLAGLSVNFIRGISLLLESFVMLYIVSRTKNDVLILLHPTKRSKLSENEKSFSF